MGIVIKKEHEKDVSKMHQMINSAWKDILSIYQKVPQTDKEWEEWVAHLNTYYQTEDGVSEEVTEFSRKMALLVADHAEKIYSKETRKKQNKPN